MKISIFYFESSAASVHPSSCGVGTLLPLTFRKGRVEIDGVLHPESIRHPSKAASPHFSRWMFFPFILCTTLIMEHPVLHLWCAFLVETSRVHTYPDSQYYLLLKKYWLLFIEMQSSICKAQFCRFQNILSFAALLWLFENCVRSLMQI